ncbi:MAG: N-hydroxyarylamine O-acetyltransferase [Myxococcales bacterium]|nr:N-hydroxyarylamine O-acetyltransferase [Myxococcales bacterium]
MIDLDAYFARIGYRGSRAPALDTLNAIVNAHVQAIPFENLDVLQGLPIDLEPSALERKLVHARRGGYCFEQNTLLLTVLGDLGFDAHPLSARVRYQRPRDYTPARTHLFVRVELDESWLVDVGVGAMSVTAALRLAEHGPQATPHEPRRLLREHDRLYHQVQLAGEWQDVCEFTLEEMPLIDRIVANWYTSAHPASHFKNRLLVARALPEGGRVGLLNRELTVRRRDGHADHRVLHSPDEMLDVLAEHFGLQFAAGTRFPCDALDWPA